MLTRIYDALDATPRPTATVRARMSGPRMSEEDFEKGLEKLWIHGGALVSPEGNALRGRGDWKPAYLEQRQHKEAQLAQVGRYAEGSECRMLHLVRHFGDQEDHGRACGACDVCASTASIALTFHTPTTAERQAMEQIQKALCERNGPSTGRLHQALFGDDLDRRHFEALLTAMARGGLLKIERDSFEAEGRQIEYRRAFLTQQGREAGSADLGELGLVKTPKARAPRKADTRSPRRTRSKAGTRPRRKVRERTAEPLSHEDAPAGLVQALKEWRLGEARRRRIPAFRFPRFGFSPTVHSSRSPSRRPAMRMLCWPSPASGQPCFESTVSESSRSLEGSAPLSTPGRSGLSELQDQRPGRGGLRQAIYRTSGAVPVDRSCLSGCLSLGNDGGGP